MDFRLYVVLEEIAKWRPGFETDVLEVVRMQTMSGRKKKQSQLPKSGDGKRLQTMTVDFARRLQKQEHRTVANDNVR